MPYTGVLLYRVTHLFQKWVKKGNHSATNWKNIILCHLIVSTKNCSKNNYIFDRHTHTMITSPLQVIVKWIGSTVNIYPAPTKGYKYLRLVNDIFKKSIQLNLTL